MTASRPNTETSVEPAGRFARHPNVLAVAVPLVATIGIAVIRGSRHFAWDWPTHAHHHLLAHITAAVGLSVVALMVLFGPLRRRKGWAWWALVVAGVAIFGGYWAGNLTVGLGIEAAQPNTAQAVLTATYTLGLMALRRQLHHGRGPRAATVTVNRQQVRM